MFYQQDEDIKIYSIEVGGSSVSRYLRQNLFAITLANLKNQCHDKNEKEPSNVTNTTLINNEHMLEENVKTNSDIDHLAFASNPFINDFHLALKTAFRIVDESVQRVSHWSYQGSCAVCCMLVDIDTNEVFIKSDDVNNTYHDGDQGNSVHSHRKTAIIANIGDSRAVLGRAGIAIPLSIDHKPNNPLERKRILSCGGSIKWCGAVDLKGRPIRNTGIYRVNGNLAISRAIGDRSERPHVCSDVDIFSYDLDETDDFIILASDGIWDVLSSQDVVSFIQKNVPSYREDYSIPSENINKRSRRDQLYTKDANSSENIARDLCEHAMNLGSTDNISVVIVWLK